MLLGVAHHWEKFEKNEGHVFLVNKLIKDLALYWNSQKSNSLLFKILDAKGHFDYFTGVYPFSPSL